MDQNTDNPTQPILPGEEQPLEPKEVPEDIAVTDALTGVITEPGETYEEVKASSKRNYWVLPIIITIVISIIAAYMVTHDNELYSEINTKQVKAARERMEEAVKEGKMSQEQMNQQLEGMEKMMNPNNPIFLVFAILGPIFSTLALLFFMSLIYWFAVKILKGNAGYMLVVCVLGLASIISAIQAVINTVLAIVTGNLRANAGLGLIATAEVADNTLFKLLSHFDLLTIWYLIIVGIGLAKVSDLKSSKTLPVVFGLWLVWVFASSFLKLSFLGG
jgi:hypothetical protein